jgi:hypothetical protein
MAESREADVFIPPSQREPPQYPAEKPTEPVLMGTLPFPAKRVLMPERPVELMPELVKAPAPKAPAHRSTVEHKGAKKE